MNAKQRKILIAACVLLMGSALYPPVYLPGGQQFTLGRDFLLVFAKQDQRQPYRPPIDTPRWIGEWILIAGASTILITWLSDARRRGKGLCSHCGYNLTGNVCGVCPECGARA